MTYASIVEYIAHYAAQTPDAAAVIAEGKETSYRELWQLIQGFARYLREEAGVCKGDVVLTKATQTLDFVVLYFATHLAGGIFAPLEGTSSGVGFDRAVAELKPKLAAVNPGDMGLNDVSWAGRRISNRDVCRIAEEHGKDQGTELAFPMEDDSAVIMFTTGTTGVSKGVEHTQRSMLAAAVNLAIGSEMKQGTHYLIPGPMNHAGPLRKSAMALVTGSTAVILNGMKNMRAIFDAIECAPGPVGCSFVPAMIRVIFSMTGDKLGEYADKIDFIVSDGAVLPELDKQRLCELLPQTRLYNNYGASEFGNACTYDYNHITGKRNCVGKSMPYAKIVVVDDEKRIMQSNARNTGLLACIGDVNMKGYWNAPELTAEVMHDGMVCTNDIGYIDEEGFIYILGRQGDVINVGGLKVAPTEVEEFALAHPAVADCVCVPVDDAITGKAVKLCVVLKPGQTLDARQMRGYLLDHLENFKAPKYIVPIDEVPRMYNGKLDRKTAAARFAGQ